MYSPGPVYFIKDEITRFGKDGTAKYTQLGRRKEQLAFKTPGPGRYENHKCHPQGKIIPLYNPVTTFATRFFRNSKIYFRGEKFFKILNGKPYQV